MIRRAHNVVGIKLLIAAIEIQNKR